MTFPLVTIKDLLNYPVTRKMHFDLKLQGVTLQKESIILNPLMGVFNFLLRHI